MTRASRLARLASLRYPLSAEASRGRRPRLAWMPSRRGTSCPWSLIDEVRVWGDDDLGLPVDRRLRVVALDIAVLGEQHAAVGIREVALRLGLGLVARPRGRPARLLSALRLALVLDLGPIPRLFGGGGFGVRFQRRLGGADRRPPLLAVPGTRG